MKKLIPVIIAMTALSQPVFAANVCQDLKQVLQGSFNAKFFYHVGTSESEVMTFRTDAVGHITLDQTANGQTVTTPVSFQVIQLHDKPSCEMLLTDNSTTFSSVAIDTQEKTADFISNQDFIDWMTLSQK